MYKKKINKKDINNLSIFTFLKEVLEVESMFADTQISYERKRKSKSFKDSKSVFRFTCKLLRWTPQCLSSIHCTGIDVAFQISLQKENRGGSSQVNVKASFTSAKIQCPG
jgi:hypothetical protein